MRNPTKARRNSSSARALATANPELETLPGALEGHGGGKGGGGGFSEDPDTLQSRAIARVIDLVSEGEIKGLVNNDEGIYLQDTPVRNAGGGSLNFQGVGWWQVPGIADQPYIPGFPSAETEVGVATDVTVAGGRIVRRITQLTTNAVRLTLGLPNGLSQTDTEEGRMSGSSVQVRIEVKPQADAGGTWITVTDWTISGKATSPYEEEFRFDLPGVGPWDVGITRLTADAVSSSIANATNWVRYTRIVDHKFSYPFSALIALEVNAEYFGQAIPPRQYLIDGIICRVPTNYDPITRAYATTGLGTTGGAWDGTFKRAWTDNPVWVFFDQLTEPRYGLGVADASVDKFALYSISQYCDVLVPDGFGGTEPRLTFNGIIGDREPASQVLQAIASTFRGMFYWGAGFYTAVQDAPRDPVVQFSQANVIGGEFNYTSTPKKARHTVAIVEWVNPDLGYKTDYLVVEDAEAIARYGYNALEVKAFGCTSRGQAWRFGKWALITEKFERQSVTFRTGLQGKHLLPGDIITIADPYYSGARMAGRLISVATDRLSVTMDAPFPFVSGDVYQISVQLSDGSLVERQIVNPGTTATTVSLVSALPASPLPVAGATFALIAEDLVPMRFRVINRKEVNKGQFEVFAVERFEGKFTLVDVSPGFDAVTTPVSKLPNPSFTSPASAVSAVYETRGGANLMQPQIKVSWDKSPDLHIAGYIVSYRAGLSNWVSLPMTNATDAVIETVVEEDYDIRVIAINAFSVPSQPVATFLAKATIMSAAGKSLVSGLALQGGGTTFAGPNAVVIWNSSTLSAPTATGIQSGLDPYFDSFRVRVMSTDELTIYRTETVYVTRWDYAAEKVAADAVPRTFKIGVSVKSKDGSYSTEVKTTFTNPAPAAPAFTLTPGPGTVEVRITQPTASDFVGYKVYASTTNGFTPGVGNLVSTGSGGAVTLVGTAGSTIYVKVEAYDTFGQVGLTTSTQQSAVFGAIAADTVAVGSVGADQLAPGAVTASKVAATDNSNMCLDPLFADATIWTLNGGWAFDTVSTDITTTLSVPKGVKLTATGANPQSASQMIFGNTVRYMVVEPSKNYRLAIRTLTKIGFKGRLRLIVNWYNQAGTFISGADVAVGTDFRSVAAVSDVVSSLDNIVTSLSTAAYMGFYVQCDWPAAAASAGTAFVASPRVHRAVSLELVSDGSINSVKLANGAVGPSQVAVNAIIASKLYLPDMQNMLMDVDGTDTAYWTGSAGWTLASVDAEIATLGAAKGFRTPTTGLVANTFYTLSQPAGQRPIVEPGRSYRVSVKLLAKALTSSRAYAQINWLKRDGTNSAITPTTGITGFDYRTVANGATDTTMTIDSIVVAPSDAYYAQYNFVMQTSSTLPIAGSFYYAQPRLERAISTELVVDGSISAVKITANSITGDRIAADTITATKLLLGDSSNAFNDPDMQDAAFYSLTGSTGGLSGTSLASGSTKRYVSTATTASQTLTTGSSRVEPSRDYYFLAVIGRDTATDNPTLTLTADWYSVDAAGAETFISSSTIGSLVATTNNHVVFVQAQSPAAARRVKLKLVKTATTAVSSLSLAGPVIRRAVTAELVVDGSITAVKILAGTITGDRMAANSITASKMYLGDPTNMIADVLYGDAAYWTNPAPAWTLASTDATAIAALNVPIGARTPTGNGTTIQTGSFLSTNLANKFPVEKGKSLRVTAQTFVKAGFTGQLGILAVMFQKDGVTQSTSPTSWGATGPNYRTTAAAVDTTATLDVIVTVPSDTYYVVFQQYVVWSTTQANAGYGFIATPRLNRAVGGELIVDGSITATKISVTSLSAISADIGTVTAGTVQNAAGTFGVNLALGVTVSFASTYMKVVGAAFGASSDLMEWWGTKPSGATIADPKLSTLTKTNGLWAQATDGKIYQGATDIAAAVAPMNATISTPYSTTHSTTVTPTLDTTASVSSIVNGVAPYTYRWAIVDMADGIAPLITNGDTATATFYRSATLAAAGNYEGTASCTIIDANGKTCVKYWTFADLSTF